MKKIFITFIFAIISIMSYGQTIKEINRSMEIVKPISIFWNEAGNSAIVNPDNTYVHLKINNFGEGNNLVVYWIEQNGEVFHKHMTEHVTVLFMTLADNKTKCYSVIDEDFSHMKIIMMDSGENGANFNTKER